MFTALLDTTVLWPSTQRDFLLSLAIEGMYRPVWSSVVLAELEYHEAAKLQQRKVAPAQARQRADRLIKRMRAGFADAEVIGWQALEGSFGLPDPDDEHVAAAAVIAGAGAIVTENFKDFPAPKLPAALQVLHARDFAMNTVSLDPARACQAVYAIADRSGRTADAWSPLDVLDILEHRYAMTEAVTLMREIIDAPSN